MTAIDAKLREWPEMDESKGGASIEWRVIRTMMCIACASCIAALLSWIHIYTASYSRATLVLSIAGYLTGIAVEIIVAVTLSKRFPFRRRMPAREVAAHVAGLALVGLIFEVIGSLIPRVNIPPVYPSWSNLLVLAALYVLIVACAQALRRVQQHDEVEASRVGLKAQLSAAERDRVESELRALKAELNPHFLANTLHSVNSLMRTDIAAADRVLGRLAELLRSVTARDKTHEVWLEEEVIRLAPFLELERARLEDRLTVEYDIADETREALVPDMLLQPLIENAVKHGLAPRHGGRIRICSRRIGRDGETLEVIVEDVGWLAPGLKELGPPKGNGVGLANLRARLSELYGTQASLSLASGKAGARATVRVPYNVNRLPTGDGGAWRGPDLNESNEPDSVPSQTSVEVGPNRWRLGWTVLRIGFFVGWFLNIIPTVLSENAFVAERRGIAPPVYFDPIDAVLHGVLLVAMAYSALVLARRHPWRSAGSAELGHRRQVLLTHTVVAVAFGVLICVQKVVTIKLTDFRAFDIWLHFGVNVSRTIIGGVITYASFASAQYLLQSLRAYTWTAASRLHLRAKLDETHRSRATAELRTLKAELNPHFVGNALAAISTLMRTDLAAAEEVVTHLATVLRSSVANSGVQEVALEREVETLQPFLALERVRLGYDLQLKWQIDSDTLAARVPHMILQPLVENAVKHGLAPRGGAGTIEVAARRVDRQLELVVRDDGVGPDQSAQAGRRTQSGFGLSNARARLSQLYGDDGTLELLRNADGGTVARVLIPWSEEPAAGEFDPAYRPPLAVAMSAAV